MKKIGLLFAFMMFVATNIYSQSQSEQAVATAVTALHSNVVNPDRKALDMLVSDALSYGHSAGKVENKEQYEAQNQAIATSIREKNKARVLFEHELLEKPFKCDLKPIKKAHLLDKEGNLLEGIKLKHLAALEPIIK